MNSSYSQSQSPHLTNKSPPKGNYGSTANYNAVYQVTSRPTTSGTYNEIQTYDTLLTDPLS